MNPCICTYTYIHTYIYVYYRICTLETLIHNIHVASCPGFNSQQLLISCFTLSNVCNYLWLAFLSFDCSYNARCYSTWNFNSNLCTCMSFLHSIDHQICSLSMEYVYMYMRTYTVYTQIHINGILFINCLA